MLFAFKIKKYFECITHGQSLKLKVISGCLMKSKFLSLLCLPAPWLVSPETNSIFCMYVFIYLVYSSSDSVYIYHAFRLFPIGSGEPLTLLVPKLCSEAPWGAAADSGTPQDVLTLQGNTVMLEHCMDH